MKKKKKEPHTYFMLECLLQLYYSYLLSYGEYVFRIWENKQTNKQKLFVKCLWMNWLIATNIYNVNKNAWGNIYIAEKSIKARAICWNHLYILAEDSNSGLNYLILSVILKDLIIHYCFFKLLPHLRFARCVSLLVFSHHEGFLLRACWRKWSEDRATAFLGQMAWT